MSSTTPTLFQPIKVGEVQLAHRIVLAPMTRARADSARVPTDLIVEFYKQRASTPGTLLITEATFPSPQASGQPNTPGIWSNEQIAGWKKITDTVHAKGSYIFLQIWCLGRTARPAPFHQEFPDFPIVGPSSIALSTSPEVIPHELTKEEIKEYLDWHTAAAAAAVNVAGFDGIEIHGANGYLVDQFLEDQSNHRTDEYGGSIANRARFALEVVEAVVSAVGQSKTAIRLSPWSTYQDMRMDDPIPTFTYLVEQLRERYPNLAYIHGVSIHAMGNEGPKDPSQEDFIHKLWAPRPFITTGGYTRETALKVAEETGQLIGFGQSFLATPDLPFRLEKNLEFNVPDFNTYFKGEGGAGYTTYPFSKEFLATQQ